MRILIVVHGFPPLSSGGTEVYADLQARCLAAAGDEVHVFTREANPARAEYAVRDERRDGVWIRWVNRHLQRHAALCRVVRQPGSGRPPGAMARSRAAATSRTSTT